MFESLSEQLGGIFDRLRGRGALDEAQVEAALGEIRTALLDADVALPVVRDFLDAVRPRAIGTEVLKSVTPGQQVVKIVHDVLIEMLGDAAPLSLAATPPVAIMMVGLQGSGKTTTTAKLARHITHQHKRKVLMASLDTQRPAAMQQLAILGTQAGIDTLPIIAGQRPVDIAARAREAARLGGFDVVLLDTAGRTHADEALMAEMAAIENAATPHETLLVGDSLTGQEAVHIAAQFAARVRLTGLILTRADGDGRGGAALSMRHETGVPIKFLGMGEALDKLEVFDARRLADRILGMGDIVGLVEKATATMDAEKADKMAARMQRGQFTLEDLAEQLKQMQNMGGLSAVLGLLPGMGKFKKQMGAGLDGKALGHQLAIVSSMTAAEKANPKILNANRKKRIATGSGTSVQAVNKLIKMHRQMADMMKKFGKGNMKNMASLLGGGAASGMPAHPSLPSNLLGGGASSPPDFLQEVGRPPQKK